MQSSAGGARERVAATAGEWRPPRGGGTGGEALR